jgi:hypothetical protein
MTQEQYVCYVVAYFSGESLLANNFSACLQKQRDGDGVATTMDEATQFDTEEEAISFRDEQLKKHEEDMDYFDNLRVAKLTITDNSVVLEWK